MILFEDNHLLVMDKPAGMLTQPDNTGRPSLEEEAKKYIKEKMDKPGAVYLHAIHRLDKPVSGIVVFAKTSKALTRLNESMRDGKFDKTYIAWVEGVPQQKEAKLVHNLLRDEAGTRVDPTGKESRLTYRLLEVKEPGSILEIKLETGRHHQIRAQLSAIGHPILGDREYGSKRDFQSDRIALHHSELSFPHPIKDIVHVKSKAAWY